MLITGAYVLGFIFVLYGVGRASLIAQRNELVEEYNFAVEFHEKLMDFLQDRYAQKINVEARDWIMLNLTEMTYNMGGHAVIGWKPAGMPPGYFQNTPILQHGLSELSRFGWDVDYDFWAPQMRDAVVRYIGDLEGGMKRKQKQLSKVMVQLGEGWQFLITLPYRFLVFSKVISRKQFHGIETGWFGRLSNFIVSTAALLSAIVQISGQWEAVHKLIFKK